MAREQSSRIAGPITEEGGKKFAPTIGVEFGRGSPGNVAGASDENALLESISEDVAPLNLGTSSAPAASSPEEDALLSSVSEDVQPLNAPAQSLPLSGERAAGFATAQALSNLPIMSGALMGVSIGAAAGAATGPAAPIAIPLFSLIGFAGGAFAGHFAGQEVKKQYVRVMLPGEKDPKIYTSEHAVPNSEKPFMETPIADPSRVAGEFFGDAISFAALPYAAASRVLGRAGASAFLTSRGGTSAVGDLLQVSSGTAGKAGGSLFARMARAGNQTTVLLPHMINMMVRTAGTRPTTFALGELSIAASGAGGAAVGEMVLPGSTGAHISGAIATTVASPVRLSIFAARKAFQAARFTISSFSPSAAESQAAAWVKGVIEAHGENVDEVIRQLSNPPEALKNIPITSGLATNSRALQAIDKKIAQRSSEFGREYKDRYNLAREALANAIKALESEGSPAALKLAAQLHIEKHNGMIEARIAAARDEVLEAAGNIDPSNATDLTNYGVRVAKILDDVHTEMRAAEGKLYDAVDQLQVPPSPAANFLERYILMRDGGVHSDGVWRGRELSPDEGLDPVIENPLKRLLRMEEEATNPLAEAEALFSPRGESVTQTFAKLASAQRGEPEQAMLNVQRKNGGGVVSFVVEHVGDLTHRMSEKFDFLQGSRSTVEDKVKKSLRMLRSQYGFNREHLENLAANAQAKGTTSEQLSQEVDKALQRYAEAHSKLEVYNEPQKWARDAAVALGRKDWQGAIDNLEKLEKLVANPKAYEEAVSQFTSPLGEAAKTIDFDQLRIIRSEALDQARAAAAAGKPRLARIYSELAEAVLEDLYAYGDDVSDALTVAREYSRKYHDIITRTFAGDALGVAKTGERRIPPEMVMVRATAGGSELTELYLRELAQAVSEAGEARMTQMMELQENTLRHVFSEVIIKEGPKAGLIDQRKLTKYLLDNARLLERFPTLRQNLSSAEKAQRLFDSTLGSMEEARNALAKSAISRLLKTEDPATALGQMINGPTPVKDLVTIARASEGNPEARLGLRRALWAWAYDQAVDNAGIFSFEKYKEVLIGKTTPTGKSFIEILKDSKLYSWKTMQQLEKLMTIAADVQDAVANAKPIESLLTQQEQAVHYVLRLMGAHLGTHIAAVTGGHTLNVTGSTTRFMMQALDSMPRQKVGEVIRHMAENPEFMAALLQKEVKPRQQIEMGLQMQAGLWGAGVGGIFDNDFSMQPEE